MPAAPEIIHGTALAYDGYAALIRGPSGAGKSDLALRCIVHPSAPIIPGRVSLIGDDYVEVAANGSDIEVRAPDAIAGKIEVRGVGIVDVVHIKTAPLIMVVELVASADVPRFPDPPARTMIAGRTFPLLKLNAFESSAAAKLLLALAQHATQRDQT